MNVSPFYEVFITYLTRWIISMLVLFCPFYHAVLSFEEKSIPDSTENDSRKQSEGSMVIWGSIHRNGRDETKKKQ